MQIILEMSILFDVICIASFEANLIIQVLDDLFGCEAGKLAKFINAYKLMRFFSKLHFNFDEQLPTVPVAFACYPLHILRINYHAICFHLHFTSNYP